MITLKQIAHRCDKVRWSGKDSFTALCVAHDDRKPSMSVTERDGKILVHCHSGCPQDAVLDALGMTKRRDTTFTPRPKPRPKVEEPPKTLPYALELWKGATDDDATVAAHPYAIKKRIGHAFGARRGKASGRLIGKDADCLIIQNRNWDNDLVGVECINAEGAKQTFGSKGMLVLGHPEGADIVHICEGWATAYAISQLFPRPFACVVAFGKSKLERFASDAKVRFRGIVISHHDDDENRDVWDRWQTGHGQQYADNIMGRINGR